MCCTAAIFHENQDVEFARDVPRPTMAQWKGNGDHNPRPDVVPGSGLAGIYRAFLPSGNLVFNFMYAAASPNGQGDGRLSPMVAMGGRDTAAGGHGQRELGRFGLPVSQEINNYRSNVTYHRWHRQNNMDNRGVSNRSDRTKDERVTGQKSARTETAEPEKKKSFAPKGAHGRHNSSADERSGFPMEGMMEAEDVAQEDRKGADMSRAIELTKRPNEMQRAKTNFKRRFLAFNTMQARNSKRRKVMEIMVNLVGHENPFPVDQELLVGVGAALDEAQLQSGDQYAHEVKLMHLEAGFDWRAPLERQLYLVKNALKRHKGPEVRANECKVEDLSEEVWKKKVRTGVSHAMPAWSYAFACIWMLRAAEAFKIKVMDVEMNEEQRLVRLFIPSSKTDQRGSGVKRTLACKCPGENCSRWCAWYVTKLCLGGRGKAQAEHQLFIPAKGNRNPGKAQMVKAWSRHVHGSISGHSARRSGAMHYTTKGMDVADIMFLGRWRSSAVFRYIEEAMQEMPANRKLLQEKAKNDPFLKEAMEVAKRGELVSAKGSQSNEYLDSDREEKDADEKKAPEIPRENPEEQNLWAISGNPRGRVAHVVARAAWGLNLDAWSTACGWHFAERQVKVRLAKDCPPNVKKCAKCIQTNLVRDKVTGGQSLAQMLAASFQLKS